MLYTRKDIIPLLESYHDMLRRQKQLEYELSNSVTDDEMIESMIFSAGDVRVSSSLTSDKTSHAALSYRERAEQVNARHKTEIARELLRVSVELNRVTYYIGLLDKPLADVLRGYYIERKGWGELEAETGLSDKALRQRRNLACDKLAAMYSDLFSD